MYTQACILNPYEYMKTLYSFIPGAKEVLWPQEGRGGRGGCSPDCRTPGKEEGNAAAAGPKWHQTMAANGISHRGREVGGRGQGSGCGEGPLGPVEEVVRGSCQSPSKRHHKFLLSFCFKILIFYIKFFSFSNFNKKCSLFLFTFTVI